MLELGQDAAQLESSPVPVRQEHLREIAENHWHGVGPRLSTARQAVMPAVRRLGANLAVYSGAYHIVGRKYAGVGVIYMLHRVVPGGMDILDRGYRIAIDSVDRVLASVRDSGWDIVDLDEAKRRLETGERRRFVVFTFDDGYADNLTLALPVFRKYGAPFTVYVTTDLLDRSMVYWWGALEELVWKANSLQIPEMAELRRCSLSTRTLAEKRFAFQILDGVMHKFHASMLPLLFNMFDEHGIDMRGLLDHDALTLDQLRQLAADPLVTIGSHCTTHRRLNMLPDADVAHEFANSRRILERLIEKPVVHLAYPFGGRDSSGEREFRMAMAAGYETAVTTRKGNVFKEHRHHYHALPRRVMPDNTTLLRNTLYGVETLLRRQPRFCTV